MRSYISLGGRRIEISSPGKLVFPDAGITKGHLVDYYQRIAETMLPHVRDRPVTMYRFPDGIGEEGFFQKEVSDYFPDWLDRVTVRKEGGTVTHALCNEAAALAYLANQATVELHIWTSRTGRLAYPDLMVIDLDPADDDFAAVRTAARETRRLLEELGLAAFVQTTGSRGLHIVTPLDGKTGYKAVYEFASDFARFLVSSRLQGATIERRKEKRGGRLFVDVGRNLHAQTFVAPYSLRARPGAPVATPVDWDELGRIDSRSYNIRNIFRRLGRKNDPWKGMRQQSRSLKEPRNRLDSLIGRDRRRRR
jgi:bifunctional non-homologous end joining protein LigD